MATPTTTMEAIRDKMLTVIEALSPTTDPRQRYQRHVADSDAPDFRVWARKYADACFRRFDVVDVTDYSQLLASDGVVEHVDGSVEVILAAPKSGRFGPNGVRDARDVLTQDLHLVNDNVAQYVDAGDRVSGQSKPRSTSSVLDPGDDDGATILAVLTLRVPFYRAVN